MEELVIEIISAIMKGLALWFASVTIAKDWSPFRRYLLTFGVLLLLVVRTLGAILFFLENPEAPFDLFSTAMQPIILFVLLIGIILMARENAIRMEQVKKSEERYRKMVETATEGIWQIDVDSKTVYTNTQMCEMLGYSPDEMLGKTIFDVMLPNDRKAAQELVTRRKDGISEQHDFRLQRKDGTTLWVIANTSPLTDAEGKYTGALALVTDISSRKQMETELRESTETLNSLVQTAPAFILLADKDGRLLFMNRRFDSYKDIDVKGKHLVDLVPAAYHRILLQAMEAVRSTHQVTEYETMGAGPVPDQGTWYLSRIGPILRDNEVVAFTVVATDITKFKEAELALRTSEERFRLLFERHNSVMLLIDQNTGEIVDANHAAEEFYGYDRDQLRALAVRDLNTASPDEIAQAMSDAFTEKRNQFLFRHKLASGEIREVEVHSSPIEYSGRTILFSIIHDITERSKAEARVRYMAFHDSLTGLSNRYDFERHLSAVLEVPTRGKYCVLYIDLDQFKVVNDTCGHTAGDALMIQLASLLRKALDDNDVIARLGGDEFGILLRNKPLEEALVVAERVLKTIREFRFVWTDKMFSISGSIGALEITESSTSLSDVMSKVDMACYAAKDAGRNRIQVYLDDHFSKRRMELQWFSNISETFQEKNLVLYMQPIVPLNKNVDDALRWEFLVRLRGKDGTLINPGAFIPVAERFNLMPQLERMIIDLAFETILMRKIEHEEREDTTYFVNLSGASLSDTSFLDYLLQKMDTSVIKAEQICFEITETVAISDLRATEAFISEARKKGYRFALDDFGSGMCSFAYLKSLEVDYVKIDGSFVKDMLNDPSDYAVVEAIHKISKITGRYTVAEHVENPETLSALKKIGVDFAQGFVISPPMRATFSPNVPAS